MADTLALRRRIKTAQNISKTTRAMQMIAASKLKRAQSTVVASRPYVQSLSTLAYDLSVKIPAGDDKHPYLQERKTTGKTLYIIVSPDKGLAGGMITNLIREFLKVRQENAAFIVIGKKLQSSVTASAKNLLATFSFGTTLPTFSQVLPIVSLINEQYLGNYVDKVKIIATHFNTVFSQTPTVIDLLPVHVEEKEVTSVASDTLFEPSRHELVPTLLHRYLEMVMYQQFLESYASYNAAQMIAMQNATNNAKDIVNDLQLLYNKARQEKITKEILDISGAAAAMSRA